MNNISMRLGSLGILLFTLSAQADWPADYQAAVAQQSCSEFKRLSQVAGADLAPLARVRYLALCMSNRAAAIHELDGMAADNSLLWLSPLVMDTMVDLAQKSGDAKTIVKYALDHEASLGAQREKELFLQDAIKAAQQIGDHASEALLRAELYRVSPRLNPNPALVDWMKVGDDFKNNNDTAGAVAIYGKIINSNQFGTIAHAKALDGIRQTYKNDYRNAGGSLQTFLNAGQRLSQFCDAHLKTDTSLAFADRQTLFDGWMQYPRDQWSYGDEPTAKSDMLAGLNKKYLEPIFRASIYWTLARVAAGDLTWPDSAHYADLAVAILQNEISNKANWTSWHWSLWDGSYWAGVLANEKTTNPTHALSMALTGAAQTPNQNSMLRFQFWAGLTQKQLGQTAAAATTLQNLMQADPSGFFGFLSHQEENVPITPLPDDNLDHVAKPASVSAADFSLLSHLVASNEYPLAQAYSRHVLNSNSLAIDELLLRGFVRDFSTLWSVSFAHMTPAQRVSIMQTHARLFFPQPYADIVHTATVRYPHIDAAYIYSIMRQESGFDPFSHSWADAYGLVQILPSNARLMEGKAGVHFTQDYELFEPSLNIALGAAFMDDMYTKMNGSFILRTISYNATTDKAVEWKGRLYFGNVREFMEEIPYAETHDYVHLVMRNYIMNQRLVAHSAFAFPIDLLAM